MITKEVTNKTINAPDAEQRTTCASAQKRGKGKALNPKIKILSILALMILGGILAGAEKVELYITPQPVQVGVPARLTIRSNDGAQNNFASELPKIAGLEWQEGISQNRSLRILNGRRHSTFELSIPFIVTKAGKYTIPSMRLTHHKERTNPLEFEAVELKFMNPTTPRSALKKIAQSPKTAQNKTSKAPSKTLTPAHEQQNRQGAAQEEQPEKEEGVTLEEAMFAKTALLHDRKNYYIGEEIPMQINVYILEGLRTELTWPTIQFGERDAAVLKDYKAVNQQNPNFEGVMKSREEINNRFYTVYSFRTAFRPITAGTMEITTNTEGMIRIPNSNRPARSDDFFEDMFSSGLFSRDRQVRRVLQTPPVELTVKQLPPVPQNAYFTGLVGTWRSETTLSPGPYKVGEPITLRINFQGSGTLDTLRPQSLQLNGFRVYPPEVDKSYNRAEIRYVLIPTEQNNTGKDNLVLPPYCTFDPVTGNYEMQTFRRKLDIEKGAYNPQMSYAPAASAVVDGAAEQEAPRRPEEILYLKKTNQTGVHMPLLKNALFYCVPLLILSMLFWIICEILHLRRETLRNDPSILRRNEAKKRKGALMAKLKRITPPEIPGEAGSEISSYIGDLMDLPQGADLSEVSSAVRAKSPELSEMLDELAQTTWMPSKKESLNEEFRKRLMKALSHLAVAAFLLPLFFLSVNAAEVTLSKTIPIRNGMEAMTAYDSGRFEEAGKYYASQLVKSKPSAEILYNMGNCLYKMGNLPKALICYERALRLSPRDSDILENLNLVRRKLGLAEKYQIQTPADLPSYLRDSLRPDEWLLVLTLGAAGIFIGLGVRRLTERRMAVKLTIIGGSVLILAGAAAFLSQEMTTYHPKYAIVTAKNVPVFSLPSEKSGRVEMKLKAGEELIIGEKRMNWVRIRSGNTEGWVPAQDVTSLWTTSSISTN